MPAASVIGCLNPAPIDAFWAKTGPEERAALHTAFNLVRATNSTDPNDLIECARSTTAYSNVRSDFSRWLEANLQDDMTAKDVMQLILQKGAWVPSNEIRS